MKRTILLSIAVFVCISTNVSADTFAEGTANEFTIDFVTIAGDASSANGTNISQFSPGEYGYKTFTDPSNNYRMGTYEITHDQWNKFQNTYGTVTGSPSTAYDTNPYWTGTNLPIDAVSWFEAAQFVNWLNTSTGHQAAYKFTGTQGTSDYTFAVWQPGDAGYNASNPYRNRNAYYFLPTEEEWIKAAYWNGINLQTYATVDGSLPIAGVDSNYSLSYPHDNTLWDVGSGSEELNGTFDMMGNIWEWMESPYNPGDYSHSTVRVNRGNSYFSIGLDYLSLSSRISNFPNHETGTIGFRVASVIPEPCTLLLFAIGGLMIWKR